MVAYHIGVKARGFTGGWAYVNSRTHITATIADLARATFCLGNTALFQRPNPTRWDRAQASAHVTKAVRRSGAGLVLRPEHFRHDEQLQKTTAFMIGTAIAKLFAEHALNAPWAVPISKLPKSCQVQRGSGVGRHVPDLLAHDRSNNWHIVEAKGSAHRLPSLSHAKKQARSVRRVNASAPATRSACLSDLRGEFLSRANDPDADSGPIDLEMSVGAYLSEYYAWFRSTPRPPYEELVGGANVGARTIDMGEQRFKIGLTSEVMEWLEGSFQGEAPRVQARSGPGFSVGPDGVVFRFYRDAIEDWE